MTDDYRALIKERVLDESRFISLVLKGRLSDTLPYRQVNARPVVIKNQRYLQFAHFTLKQDITKNYTLAEADGHLDELLSLPFTAIQVRSTDEDLNVQITKKGKVIIHRGEVETEREPHLAHDAPKTLPIPADRPDVFLQAAGIQSTDGKIKADMSGKFAQVNEFLKLLEHTGALENFDHAPLEILDCGCGSSYLTFGLYHYLNDIRGIPARLTGVDNNEKLITKSNRQAEKLVADGLCFVRSPIGDFQPEVPPDIVVALHACDTATDDSLAVGIRGGAGLILAVPCCHHDLNRQLQAVAPFAPVLRHGILKQRMADMLTDTFRALILRIMGYKTDVIEFISSEHTDRNLMIRAVKRVEPGEREFVREYRELRDFWGVIPYLEKLLGKEFARLME